MIFWEDGGWKRSWIWIGALTAITATTPLTPKKAMSSEEGDVSSARWKGIMGATETAQSVLISKCEKWTAALGGTKFGHAFDKDDILMRLCRNPCDEGSQSDETYCACKVPCRLKEYQVMAELAHLELGDELGGVQARMFPKPLEGTPLQMWKKTGANWNLATFLKDIKTHVNDDKQEKPRKNSVDGSGVPIAAKPWELTSSGLWEILSEFLLDNDENLVGGCSKMLRRSFEPKDAILNRTRLSPLVEGMQENFGGERGPAMPPPPIPGPVDYFVALGSYNTFKDAVTVDIKLVEIINLDEQQGCFDAKFDVTVSWYDGNYDTPDWINTLKKSDGVEVTSYCAPCITILDVMSGDDGWYRHNGVAVVMLGKSSNGVQAPAGMVSKTLSFTSTIRDDNPIQKFPFDQQELTIELEMPSAAVRGTIDYGRYLIPINISVENRHKNMTWTYHRAVGHITKPRGCVSHMVAAFRICRRPETWLWNVLLILFMIGTLSLSSFLIPVHELADRGTVTMTLLLTVVAFKLLLSDNLPKVSYLTLLDNYVLAAFMFIFFVAIESIVMAFLTGVPETFSCAPVNSESGNTSPAAKDCEPVSPEFCADKSLDCEPVSPEFCADKSFLSLTCFFFSSAGVLTMEEAMDVERQLVFLTVCVWFIGHLGYWAYAMVLLKANVKLFGEPVGEEDGGIAKWNYFRHTRTRVTAAVFSAFALLWYYCGIFMGVCIFVLVVSTHSYWWPMLVKWWPKVVEPLDAKEDTKEDSNQPVRFDPALAISWKVAEDLWGGVEKTSDIVEEWAKIVLPKGAKLVVRESTKKLEQNSFEAKELTATIFNAGLALEMVNLVPTLIKRGLDVQHIKTHDPQLLSEALGHLNIKLEDRMCIISSAKEQVKTLFLQGSASYMMQNLKMDGKLATKGEIISRIGANLREGYDPRSFKQWDKEGTSRIEYLKEVCSHFLFLLNLRFHLSTPSSLIRSPRLSHHFLSPHRHHHRAIFSS
jgi:hypothetical protein